MKCNDRELAQLSGQPCVLEGRLNYKKSSHGGYLNQTVFKERWFRLINNYLFYFKLSEMGKFDTKNPAGVFVMENSSIEMEHGQSIPFAFSVSFLDEPERRHIFAARSEENVVQWVMQLRVCSYEYLRSKLHTLQSKIYSMTGKDPLLMVPRNDGAKLWAPSVPFSTATACHTGAGSSFNCHLHTNGIFTLERSKSDLHMRVKPKRPAPIVNHTHEFQSSSNVKSGKATKETGFSLERSKTTAVVQGGILTSNNTIFDTRPVYSRAAPSPPVRKKTSPRLQRETDSPKSEAKFFAGISQSLSTTSILEQMPVPPRRKISPRVLDIDTSDACSIERCESTKSKDEEDLIKF